jgi:hypothetical protein
VKSWGWWVERLPDVFKIMVRRSVYEAAQKLEAEFGAGAEEEAFRRGTDGIAARDTTGVFWRAVSLYLREKRLRPHRIPDIVEDAGKGWPPTSRPGAEPLEAEWLAGLDFGGGESDQDMRDRWTKQTEGMRAWIDREMEKKGGGST